MWRGSVDTNRVLKGFSLTLRAVLAHIISHASIFMREAPATNVRTTASQQSGKRPSRNHLTHLPDPMAKLVREKLLRIKSD